MVSPQELGPQARKTKAVPTWTKYIFPAAVVFSIIGVGYAFYWNDTEKAICINCKRQQAIADEFYGKPPHVPQLKSKYL